MWVSVDKELAELLVLIVRGKCYEHGFYVQDVDFDGTVLENPNIWQYKFWANDAERRKRLQFRAEEERKARFVFNANVKLLSKAARNMLGIEGDPSIVFARKMLSKKNCRQLAVAVGVERLYETIEEIP